jgi:hypothetical protein
MLWHYIGIALKLSQDNPIPPELKVTTSPKHVEPSRQ